MEHLFTRSGSGRRTGRLFTSQQNCANLAVVTELASRVLLRPSFLEGAARCIDITGSLNRYRIHRTGEEADRAALENDWRWVHRHLREAVARELDQAQP